jgi:hypothetical protein
MSELFFEEEKFLVYDGQDEDDSEDDHDEDWDY